MKKMCFLATCACGGRCYLMEDPVMVAKKDVVPFFKDCVHHHTGLRMREREADRFLRIGCRRITSNGVTFEFSWN